MGFFDEYRRKWYDTVDKLCPNIPNKSFVLSLIQRVKVQHVFFLYLFAFAGYCAVFYNLFYFFSGGYFFVRPDLSDIGFHFFRCMNPFAFLQGYPYYPPLFHLIIFFIPGSTVAALHFFLPILFFILLPYSFYRLSRIYWDNEFIGVSSGLIYLFGSIVTLVFISDGIYPQALSLFFLVMGIGSMIHDLKYPTQYLNWLPFLWGILTILSHSKGIVLYLPALLIWLFLRKSLLFFPGLVFSILSLPFISIPPISVISPKQAAEIFLFWFNPLTLYFAYTGFRNRQERPMILFIGSPIIMFTILLTLLFSWVDPTYRPLLFTSALLSVFAGKGLYDSSKGLHSFILLIIVWILVLIFCTMGIYGLYILPPS